MEKQLFRKIEPESLSEKAVEMLRDTIVRGELSPGERLNERAIARQMGISRVPVREAIQQLAYEGLLINTPNRGSFVRYFEELDVVEIFSLRAVLEGLAAQIVVQEHKLEAADFDYLESCMADQQQAIATGNYDGWVDAEIRFHSFICKKSGCPRLFKGWRDLHVQCLFATHERWTAYLQGYGQNYGSHPVILDALRHGDPEQMIPLHQDIYARIRQSVLKLIRSVKQQERSHTGL